jgi:hypothetical protein
MRLESWPFRPLCGPGALLLTRLVLIVGPFCLRRTLTSPRLQRVRRRVLDPDSTGYLGEVRNFLVAVTEGREPSSRPEDPRRDLEIVLCGYEALRGEGWASIRPHFGLSEGQG